MGAKEVFLKASPRLSESETVRPENKGLGLDGVKGSMGTVSGIKVGEVETGQAEASASQAGEEVDDRVWFEPNRSEQREEPEVEVKSPFKRQWADEVDTDEIDSDGEEARVPKGIRAPKGPTKAEREDHER